MSDDPRRTSRVLLFEEHYANLGDELRWDVDRFHRLCAALQLTEYELGAMLRIRVQDTERCILKNRFAPPVELHLTLLERSVFPNSKPSVFPKCS